MQKMILENLDDTSRKDDIQVDSDITDIKDYLLRDSYYARLVSDVESEISDSLVKIWGSNFNQTSKTMEIPIIKVIYRLAGSQKALVSDTHESWILAVAAWEKVPRFEPIIESRRLLFERVSSPIKAGMAGLGAISAISAISSILALQLGNTGIAMILLGPSISGTVGLFFLIKILLRTQKSVVERFD